MTTRTMLATLALIVALAACTNQAPVSEDKRTELAETLASILVDDDAVGRLLDEGADLAQPYSVDTLELQLGRNLTDGERQTVRQTLRGVLAEFITEPKLRQITGEACEQSFSASELDSMIEFFRSPAGSRFLELQPSLSSEIDDRVLDLLQADSDAFADRVDGELAAAFPGLDDGTEP